MPSAAGRRSEADTHTARRRTCGVSAAPRNQTQASLCAIQPLFWRLECGIVRMHPPNPPMQPTPLRVPKIGAFLTFGIHLKGSTIGARSGQLNATPLGARRYRSDLDAGLWHSNAGRRARIPKRARAHAILRARAGCIAAAARAQPGVAAERLDRGVFGIQTQQEGISDRSTGNASR